MNLKVMNIPCSEWAKEDWQWAYKEYCKYNQFGRMSKKEYFNFVNNNYKRLEERSKPFSTQLASKWSQGRKNARLWAKKVGYRASQEPELLSVSELEEHVRNLEWKLMNKKDT